MAIHVCARGLACVALVAGLLGASAAATPPSAASPGAAAPLPALLRDRVPGRRPTLLLIGTGHFSNRATDVVNVPVDDVLAPRRQAELEALVARLARFRPTRVALEWPADRQPALDERYRAYRAGEYALTRSEIDQIGLRLAARLGLDRVHAVDWNDYPPGDFALYDWDAWAKAHGREAIIAAMRDPSRPEYDTALDEQPLIEWLRVLNDPAHRARSHRAYYDYAMLGDEQAQPGANWLGHWHARNLRIFARLVRLAGSPDDRVLAIYGSGHAHLLDRFARESGAFEVVDPVAALDAQARAPEGNRDAPAP